MKRLSLPRKKSAQLRILGRFCKRITPVAFVLGGILLAAHWASGATTLIWDASTTSTTDGVQDGAGTWNSTNTNWWNGSMDVAWTDSTSGAPVFAQFGGGTNTTGSRAVTVNGPFSGAGLAFVGIAGSISTTNPAYSLSGGTITIADNGTITIADGASVSGSFVTVNSALAGNNITVGRSTGATEQFITFGGTNTWTGTLTLDGGTGGLFVRATSTAALNSLTQVIVPSSVTLDLSAGGTYTPNFVVSGSGDGSTARGAIRFDTTITLTGGITLAGDAVLNFQNSIPVAANVTVTTNGITESGGSFSFTKTGLGKLTLQAPSTYSGATIIAPAGTGADPGTLVLDFYNSTTTDNLLYHGLSTPGALVLTGNASRDLAASTATLSILGADFTDNTQAFNGLTVTGPTAISLQSGLAGSVTLSLGSITRSGTGTTLSITAPSSGTITMTTNVGSLLGTWATFTDGAGFTTWAGSDSNGNLQAFTGDLTYRTGTDISALPGYNPSSNLTIASLSSGPVTQSAGTTQLNTITMSATNADRVVSIGAGNTLDLGTAGGIQLLAGARSLTIGSSVNTGTLTAGTTANSELFLSNFDSLNLMTVNSVIANNSGGAVIVVLNGSGTTILNGTNTYSGQTILNSGILKITSASALGTTAGSTLVGAGAVLELSGGITIAEPLTLSGTGVSNTGALRNISGNNTSNGLITLAQAATITADAGTSLNLLRNSATSTVIIGNFGVTFGGEGNITVGSVIGTSTGTLAKDGSGMLFLNAANTYSGSTGIHEGTVRISTATGLGTAAAGTTVSSGAALELTNGITVGAEALTLSGTGVSNGGALRNISGNNTYGGAITLAAAARINSDSGTLTLSGSSIGGTAALTLGGSGNITITAPIMLTTGNGTVTKDGTGTLSLGANNIFGDAVPLTIDGGTFAVGAFSDTLGALTLKNGAITGTGTLTATSIAVQNGSISANLAGSTATVGLTKSTTNTVTLSGTNTYTGTTTVDEGRLILDYSGGNTVLPAANAVALAGGTLEVKGASSGTSATLGAVTTSANSGMSTLAADANTALTAASFVRGSGSAAFFDLSATGSGLKFTTAPAVSNGQITAGGGNAAIVMKDSSGRYDFAALDAGNNVVRLNATTALLASGTKATTPYLLTGNNDTFSLAAAESVSSLRIDSRTAGGTLDLAGNTLTVSLFGILNDGSNDFKITNSGTAGSLFGTSAIFVYQFGTGKLTLDASISSSQAFLMGSGLIDWTAAAGGNGANHIYGATVRLSGSAVTLNNSVTTGNGIGVINIASGGILELASGDLTRPAGTGTNNVNLLGDGGFSAYGADRAVNLGGAGSTLTWGSTSGFLANGNKLILGSPYADATVDFQNNLNLNGGYQTVEVQSANVTGVGGKISGNIVGAGGGLAKTGQGILTLAGANTYTGITAVNAGTLLVSGSLNGTSAVSVALGAELKLSGAGTIAGGSLSLSDGSKLSLEVGTLTSSTISLTGNASLSGSVTLALTLTADPTDGTTFTLLDGNSLLAGYSSGARFFSNGSALADGSVFTVSNDGLSQMFEISYGGSDGNDVTIQAVPEPNTVAALIASTGLLLTVSRFRRRAIRLSTDSLVPIFEDHSVDGRRKKGR